MNRRMIDAEQLATLFDEAGRAIDPVHGSSLTEWERQQRATALMMYAIAGVYRSAAERRREGI